MTLLPTLIRQLSMQREKKKKRITSFNPTLSSPLGGVSPSSVSAHVRVSRTSVALVSKLCSKSSQMSNSIELEALKVRNVPSFGWVFTVIFVMYTVASDAFPFARLLLYRGRASSVVGSRSRLGWILWTPRLFSSRKQFRAVVIARAVAN